MCNLISPFLLNLLYKVTSVLMKDGAGGRLREADAQSVEAMKISLGHLSHRWLAAGQ